MATVLPLASRQSESLLAWATALLPAMGVSFAGLKRHCLGAA